MISVVSQNLPLMILFGSTLGAAEILVLRVGAIYATSLWLIGDLLFEVDLSFSGRC